MQLSPVTLYNNKEVKMHLKRVEIVPFQDMSMFLMRFLLTSIIVSQIMVPLSLS